MTPSGSSLRLVVVEDHAALREAIGLLLGREGCEVVGTAGTAAEGFDLVGELEPDVTIVDIGLPEEDGIGLTRRLLDRDPNAGVLLYTGLTDAEVLFEGLDSGARGYALKEGSPKELVEAIKAVASGGTWIDPRLSSLLLSRKATRRSGVLSPRETEVLDLLAKGLTGEEIAKLLFLSPETIRTHVRNAMEKLEAHTRVHAIAIAIRQGEIALSDGR